MRQPPPLLLLSMLSLLSCTPSAPPAAIPRASVTFALTRQGDQAPVRVEGKEEVFEVTGMVVVVSDIELHLCPKPTASRPQWTLISTAWAHVPHSATRLGTPVVEDWLGEPGKTRAMGEVAPPFGLYCGVWVVVAPADRDVLNPTALETAAVLGKSVVIRGRKRPVQGGPWEAFELSGALKVALPVAFGDPKTGAASLRLGPERSSAFLRITKRIDQAFWRRPEVLESLEQGRLSPAFATALGATLALITPPPHVSPPGATP